MGRVLRQSPFATLFGRPDPVRIKPDRKRPRWRAPCHSPTKSPCHSGWAKASTWHRSNTRDPPMAPPQRFAQQAQPAPPPPTERTNYAARRSGYPLEDQRLRPREGPRNRAGPLADHARSPDIHAMPKGHITGDQTVWKDGNRGIFPTLAAPFAAEMADAAPAPTDDALTNTPTGHRPAGRAIDAAAALALAPQIVLAAPTRRPCPHYPAHEAVPTASLPVRHPEHPRRFLLLGENTPGGVRRTGGRAPSRADPPLSHSCAEPFRRQIRDHMSSAALDGPQRYG